MKVRCEGSILADNVKNADSFMKRFIGLMGKNRLDPGEGLLLSCSSIHCFFMKIPIDAVYISKKMTVLGMETLKPWRVGKWFPGTKYVLELQAGAASSVVPGAVISLE
jgi:uncharacterized membrane protein (UPF0127 family)